MRDFIIIIITLTYMNKDTLRFQHKNINSYNLQRMCTRLSLAQFLYTTMIKFFELRVVSKMHTNNIKKLFYRAQLKQNQLDTAIINT